MIQSIAASPVGARCDAQMKVLAAVVTHNRSKLVLRCVDHLRKQTRVADHVIVINNASTDDTEIVLKAHGVNVITQGNVGGAGGFARAIEYALENGFDAIWLMDDDGYPDAQALEHLVNYMGPGIACASSVVLREDDREHFVFPFPVLDRDGFPAIFRRPRKLPSLTKLRDAAVDGAYPFAHFFNGCLITTEAIRKIGNVDTRFFIFGDEVDYFFRLRRVGKVCSLLQARHYHPDVTSRPLNDFKFYYFVKNTIILNRRYMNQKNLRNLLTISIALARTASRNGIGTAMSYLIGRRARILGRAMTRGFSDQVGADFE
jgi:GT2 family glycosyltransferase